MTIPPSPGAPDVRDRTASVPATLQRLAVQAARAAGEELLTRFGGHRDVSSKSTRTDMVSDADRIAEDTIVEMVKAQRPGDGIVAEEGTREASSTGVSWVIDPLDGTTNYLYGDHEWSVSIAAVDGEGAVAAAILAPTTGRLYSAARGGGAWEGEIRLRCSRTTDLDLALVMAGLDYQAETRRRQMAMFSDLTGSVRDIRRHGSAALELCRVAEGSADAYLESPIQWWDIAAGALIAAEAGAEVAVDVLGGSRRSIFACTPGVRGAFVAWLAEHPDAQPFEFVAAPMTEGVER